MLIRIYFKDTLPGHNSGLQELVSESKPWHSPPQQFLERYLLQPSLVRSQPPHWPQPAHSPIPEIYHV